MNAIEYIEQQHQLVLSNEVQDYISNLKDYEDYIIPYVYKDLAIFKGNGKCKVFTSIEYPNTCDWVELNSAFAIIYTHHFFNRYRKRKSLNRNLNIRCNLMDRALDVVNTLWNLTTYLAICNGNEEGLLSTKGQPFYWCEDGLIPVTAISPTILRCNTFLSVDILSEKQSKFWHNIYNDIYKQNK
nr:MAG TPA: hypothetical protein [Caudoviricetes sp.]